MSPRSSSGCQSFRMCLNVLKSPPPVKDIFLDTLTSARNSHREIQNTPSQTLQEEQTNLSIIFLISLRSVSWLQVASSFFRFSKSEQALLYSSTMLLQADSMMTWTPGPPRFSLDKSTCQCHATSSSERRATRKRPADS